MAFLIRHIRSKYKYTLFHEQRSFSMEPQCCSTLSCIELQMLLRCCLIHITIIILRHILYLVYLRPCLALGLFMSYLCDLFSIFCLIFVAINHITLFKPTYLLFVHFLEYHLLFWDDNVDGKSKFFQVAKIQLKGDA